MKKMPAFVLLFMCLSLLSATAGAQTTWYVDAARPDNSGAGTSWATAEKELQVAIDEAVSGDSVWVKAGTYKPTTGTDRNASFVLKEGVAVYGGFAGTETQLFQRNDIYNITILSGDLLGNDVGFTNNGENSKNVVTYGAVSNATILDGFTVTKGNSDVHGAGIGGANGSPVLNNIVFTTNTSINSGGAAYFDGGSPMLNNCVFDNNVSTAGGGAVHTFGITSIKFTNCVFYSNTAAYGGGFYINASIGVSFINCTFSKNTMTGGAGPVNAYLGYISKSDVSIKNSIIRDATTTPSLFFDLVRSNFTAYYSLIHGSWAAQASSIPSPEFINVNDGDGPDNIWRTPDDGLRISCSSPAINASDPSITNTKDVMGITRTGIADIGAYESGTVWYLDADGDGYYTGSGVTACASPGAGYKYTGLTAGGDCDDNNANVAPGAAEVCDGIDNNCNGQIDEGLSQHMYYLDADADGYGNATATITDCSTTPPIGYVTDNTDCDDSKASLHPGATEVCNGVDDDCDGQIDEGIPTVTYYRDADGDGYGNAAISTTSCSQPTGYVTNSTDCDDTKSSVHPNATEVCGNGIDDNCNGQTDENCGGIPTISINDVAVYESEGVAVVTISLDKVSSSAITIKYATQSGTAIGSGKGVKAFDFTTASGSVTIAAGAKTAQVRIVITKDAIAELAENFKVNLSLDAKNAKIATITRSSGTITINDGIKPALRSSQIQSKSNREIISESISITARPNPSSYQFTLRFNSAGKAPATLRVIDASGRVIETKTQVRPGTDIIVGMDYKPGIYFAVAIQEVKKVVIKLLK